MKMRDGVCVVHVLCDDGLVHAAALYEESKRGWPRDHAGIRLYHGAYWYVVSIDDTGYGVSFRLVRATTGDLTCVECLSKEMP